MPFRPHLRSGIVGTALLSAACAGDAAAIDHIANIRPLAIRVDVVGDDSVPTRVESLPFETVRVTPFVVDPEGPIDVGDIDPRFIACVLDPRAGVGSCIRSQAPLSANLATCAPTDLAALESGELPTFENPCVVEAPDPNAFEFDIPLDTNFLFGSDVELLMVGSRNNANTATDDCVEHYFGDLSREIPDDCMFTLRRIPVGPDAALIQAGVDLGVIPTDVELPPAPPEPPEPDRNVDIVFFSLDIIDETGRIRDTVVIERGDTVQARFGEDLYMRAVAHEDSIQQYSVTVEQGLRFDTRDELLRGRWFRSWGQFLARNSDDPLSFNIWTLLPGGPDEDRPAGDTATLYYVLRDGRSGVDWFWFHVDVLPPVLGD